MSRGKWLQISLMREQIGGYALLPQRNHKESKTGVWENKRGGLMGGHQELFKRRKWITPSTSLYQRQTQAHKSSPSDYASLWIDTVSSTLSPRRNCDQRPFSSLLCILSSPLIRLLSPPPPPLKQTFSRSNVWRPHFSQQIALFPFRCLQTSSIFVEQRNMEPWEGIK